MNTEHGNAVAAEFFHQLGHLFRVRLETNRFVQVLGCQRMVHSGKRQLSRHLPLPFVPFHMVTPESSAGTVPNTSAPSRRASRVTASSFGALSSVLLATTALTGTLNSR